MAEPIFSYGPPGRAPDAPGQDKFTSELLSAAPRLKRFALSLTRNVADADDLVQEALMRAWGARASFQRGTNLKAWVFRIAHNCFLTDMRKAWRQVEWDWSSEETALVQLPGQEEGAYARDLERLLGSVARSQRVAIEAVSVQGLSYEEAAIRLGVAVGTVKSRIGRGRAAITERMYSDHVLSLYSDGRRKPVGRSTKGD